MENQAASARIKPLSLVDMSSAFVVLGLGLSLAVLVFLLELIYKRIQDHYFTDHDIEERSPVVAKKKVKAVKREAIKKGVNFATKNIQVAPAIPAPPTAINQPITAAATKRKKIVEPAIPAPAAVESKVNVIPSVAAKK